MDRYDTFQGLLLNSYRCFGRHGTKDAERSPSSTLPNISQTERDLVIVDVPSLPKNIYYTVDTLLGAEPPSRQTPTVHPGPDSLLVLRETEMASRALRRTGRTDTNPLQ